MALHDKDDQYGWLSIALHWIAAIFIIYLYFDGEGMHEAADRAERLTLQAWHISVGMIALLFLAVRIFWRLKQGERDLPAMQPALTFLARWVPRILLIAIALLIITGPLIPWTAGREIAVFDWFSIASPISAMPEIHGALEEVHEIASHAVFYVAILHILGGLKHLLIDKDNVMQRMLPFKKD